MQKLRHLTGIDEPYLLLFQLFSFLLGAQVAFLRLSPFLIGVGLLTLFLFYFAYKRGRIYLVRCLVFFLLSFVIFIVVYLLLPPLLGVGVIVRSKENYFLVQIGFNRYYVSYQNSPYQVGDLIDINGIISDLSFTEYESRFSFTDYLLKKGVRGEIESYNIKPLFLFPLRFNVQYQHFLLKLPSPAREMVGALLFDYKDYESQAITFLDEAGVLYFFSVSGLTLGLFLRAVDYALSMKFQEKTREIVLLVFLIFLLPFYIFKIGYYRHLFTKFYKVIYRRKTKESLDYFRAATYSMATLLLIDFRLALDYGFLLTYILSYLFMFSRAFTLTFNRKTRKVLSFFLISIFLFPFLIQDGTYHILQPFFSLLLLPLIWPLQLFAFLSYLTFPIPDFLNGYSNFLLLAVQTLNRFDVLFPVGVWNLNIKVLYFIFIFFLFYFREIGFKKWANLMPAFCLVLLLIRTIPVTNFFTSSVHFINVGQGDSILIVDKGVTALIDTGGVKSFSIVDEVLLPYFRKEKIYHLDYLILTHDDFDHAGGKDDLLNNFKVKQLIENPQQFPLIFPSFTMQNLNIFSGKDQNDKSLVLSFSLLAKEWLLMGDASIEIEKKIMHNNPSLDCDILKVGHHGSETSSSLEFLKQITPSEAIISVGKNNYYGHPSSKVIKNLKAVNAVIRRTDQEGTIVYH